jgi:diacylglycerol kinase (ATP)
VYGGDGTVSDAAAAVSSLKNKPVVAFLPAGSGNDWIKSLGFKNATVASCVAAMAKGATKQVDTGFVYGQVEEDFSLTQQVWVLTLWY